jgi:CRISPR-associated protein Csm2
MKEIVLDYISEPQLFNERAEEWAKGIYDDREYIEKEKRGRLEQNFKNDPTKPTQMRKFFDQLLKWHNEVTIDKKDIAEVLPFVRMIKSKVEYAYSRELISKTFRKMMSDCIDQTNDEKSLRNFKLFFEAVLGFYKGRN